MESDESLWERMRAGDLAAFDALYERYERRLFGFILALLGDAAEAEDVFHESFLQLLRTRPSEFRRDGFRAWLYQVARNRCLNRLRARGRGERATRAAAGEPPPAPPDPAEALVQNETARALGEAVARLPPALSEVYRLRASGLSYEEMARVLSVPLGTVKSRMHEMVSALRKEMRGWRAAG